MELADELVIPANETDAEANKTLHEFCDNFPEAIKEGVSKHLLHICTRESPNISPVLKNNGDKAPRL